MVDSPNETKVSFTSEELQSVGLDPAEIGSNVVEIAFYLSQQSEQRSEEVLVAIKKGLGEDVAELIGKLSDSLRKDPVTSIAVPGSDGDGHDGLQIPLQGGSSLDAQEERTRSAEEIEVIVNRMLELFNEHVDQYVNDEAQYNRALLSFMRGIRDCFGALVAIRFDSQVPEYQQSQTTQLPQPNRTFKPSGSSPAEAFMLSGSQISSGP